MSQPITREYGSPIRQNLTSFNSPDNTANLPKSTECDADLNGSNVNNVNKQQPRSMKKVEKNKVDQPATSTAAIHSQPTPATEPTKSGKDQTATIKHKLKANSPPVSTKKTKDTQTNGNQTVTKVIINGKAVCRETLISLQASLNHRYW